MSPRGGPSKRAGAVLELTGELTIQTAGEQFAILVAALESQSEIHLDLTGITELDTAGVQLLLMAQRDAEGLGTSFRIDRMAPGVADTLAIAGLDTGLNPDPCPGVDVDADLASDSGVAAGRGQS